MISVAFNFVRQCYSGLSFLSFSREAREAILSENGVQQGDPIAPALFCNAIKNLTHSLKSSLNIWYMDDGTLGGSVEKIEQDVSKSIELSFLTGLILNSKKCKIFIPNYNPEDASNVYNRIN